MQDTCRVLGRLVRLRGDEGRVGEERKKNCGENIAGKHGLSDPIFPPLT